MYLVLKNYMVLNGVQYIAHPSLRRVSYGLVYMIFEKEVDKNRAFALPEN